MNAYQWAKSEQCYLLPSATVLSRWCNMPCARYGAARVFRVTCTTAYPEDAASRKIGPRAVGAHSVLQEGTYTALHREPLDGDVVTEFADIREESSWKDGFPCTTVWYERSTGAVLMFAKFDKDHLLHADGHDAALVLRFPRSKNTMMLIHSNHGVFEHPVENTPCRVGFDPDGTKNMELCAFEGKEHRSDGEPSSWKKATHERYMRHGRFEREAGPAFFRFPRGGRKAKASYYRDGVQVATTEGLALSGL